MQTIQLTKNYSTQVDDKEYARCMEGPKWHANEAKHKDGSTKNVYAVRHVRLPNGKRAKQKMHRFILGVTDPQIKVDHWDHDGLNNQGYNIRAVTHTQNQHNRRLDIDNTSGYKGVCWHKAAQKWQASIRVDGKSKHLGLFTDAEQAALAYDTAALELHKQFAYTNALMAQEVAA